MLYDKSPDCNNGKPIEEDEDNRIFHIGSNQIAMDNPEDEGNPDQGMDSPPICRNKPTKQDPCQSNVNQNKGRPPCDGKKIIEWDESWQENSSI
jgi:hypothetical protein